MRAFRFVVATVVIAIAGALATAAGAPAPDAVTTGDGVGVATDQPLSGTPPVADLKDVPAPGGTDTAAGASVPEAPANEACVDCADPGRALPDAGYAMREEDRAEFRRRWGLDDLRDQLREAKREEVRARGGEPVARPGRRDMPWVRPGWPWGLGYRDFFAPPWYGWRWDVSPEPGLRHGYRGVWPDGGRAYPRWWPDSATPDWRDRARPRYEGPWPWDNKDDAPDAQTEGAQGAISL